MPSDTHGKAVIFSAPSGAGKTTIVRHLLGHPELNLAFSVSATTRPPRGTEQDGVDYHFLTVDAFEERIDAGALLEWEEVYPGKFYGTLHTELERLWAAGKTVVFDVDVVGGVKLRRLLGDSARDTWVRVTEIGDGNARQRIQVLPTFLVGEVGTCPRRKCHG